MRRVRRPGRSRPQTLQTLPQARLVCRLFPGKKSRRYLSFSFLFSRRPKTETETKSVAGIRRLETFFSLEARDSFRGFRLSFLYFFIFTGSESNVRHGRSRPQTLQTLPQARLLYYTSLLYYTILHYTILYYTILYYTILYYTSLLVFLSVQTVDKVCRR